MALGRLASELFCFCFFFFVCVLITESNSRHKKKNKRRGEEKKRNKPFRNATTIRPSSCAIANAALLFAHDPSKRSSFSSALLVCSSSPPPPLSSVLWAGRPSPAPMARGRREGGASTPRRTMPHQGRGKHDEKKEKKRREKLVFFFFFSLLVTSRRRFAHIDEAQGTRTNAAPSTHTRERCIGPFSLSDLPRTNDDVLFFFFSLFACE